MGRGRGRLNVASGLWATGHEPTEAEKVCRLPQAITVCLKEKASSTKGKKMHSLYWGSLDPGTGHLRRTRMEPAEEMPHAAAENSHQERNNSLSFTRETSSFMIILLFLDYFIITLVFYKV